MPRCVTSPIYLIVVMQKTARSDAVDGADREGVRYVTMHSLLTTHSPWLKLNPLFTRRFQSASAFLRQNFRSILEEHRRTLGQRPKADMVDVMISEKEGGKGLTDDDIIDQILTFFFAGVRCVQCLCSLTHSVARHHRAYARLGCARDQLASGHRGQGTRTYPRLRAVSHTRHR